MSKELFQNWFSSGQDPDGNDGPPAILRDSLIQLEQSGVVDFDLAGHTCARPASVCQGAEEQDRFFTKIRIVI